MTDHPFPPDDPDDPAAQDLDRRRMEFAQLSERVADVPPPPPGLLEAQVERALQEMGPAPAAVVVPLRRSRWRMAGPLGAVAAAALALALVSTGVFDNAGRDQDQVAGMAADDAEQSDTLATAQAEAGEDTGADQPPTFSYQDTDALTDDAAERYATRRSGTEVDGGGAALDGSATDPCGAADALEVTGEIIAAYPALLGGREVTVVLSEDPGGARVGVVDDLTCEVVLDDAL